MTTHNSNGTTDLRQLPDRTNENNIAHVLREYAGHLTKLAWALDEALSAERKAGVYRVGLHDTKDVEGPYVDALLACNIVGPSIQSLTAYRITELGYD